MTPSIAPRIVLVSLIFAAPALAQAPAGDAPSKASPKQSDAGKYAGIKPLIREHRAEQVKMVKLWQAMKAGSVDEKTREAYKDAQLRTQQASNKVTRFMAEERWTDADRAIMNKMWTDELEKPVE